MADVKISQLPSATTPLAGTEVLPIVQSGVTKQVSVANVLASTQSAGTANGVMYLNGSKVQTTGTALQFDGSNLGVGGAASAWSASFKVVQLLSGSLNTFGNNNVNVAYNNYFDGANSRYITTNAASYYGQQAGAHQWFTAPSGTAGNAISFTQAMTLTAGGQLLVGLTTGIGANTGVICKGTSAGEQQFTAWNATTSGDPYFAEFATETTYTARGSIRYSRGTGLTNYNTTSDYRAKDIIGPVIDSGAVIDSTPVYMGKMKDATQERPMFIAHEVPAYARTGEKDAVDADGKPVYQQMDASALVPVMWAEIQSLRARVAALEAK